jgi:rubredoxin
MKKCPVCNSTRYENVEGNKCCARCGFVNKSFENLEKGFRKDS